MSPCDVVARIKNLPIPAPQFKENCRLFRLGQMYNPPDTSPRATSALACVRESKPGPLPTDHFRTPNASQPQSPPPTHGHSP